MRKRLTPERKKQRDNTAALFSSLAKILAPPPKLTISEWAAQNRWLASDVSSVPGLWRNDIVPYLVGPMDAISDPTVERVIIMSAARLGKTSIILNMIGYYIQYDPSLIMVVLPTFDLGERFSKKQLAPMLRDTQALKGKVADTRSRDSTNTLLMKTFLGGNIQIAGANSPNSLRADTIKILAFDEVDGAPDSAGTEGDPVTLSVRRTTTYEGRGRKIILTSTPTNKGESRIEQAYSQSTMEQWCLPCPTCGEYQPLDWKRLDFSTLLLHCRECEAGHTKGEWTSNAGKWIAENPDALTRGFRMNALPSPFVRWETLVEEWREAVALSQYGNHNQLKVFINTVLGETWEERGEQVNEAGLMARRELYYADVPDGVCLLTMGVDTHDSRLCYTVVGWGAGKECWFLEYGELWGDPRSPVTPVWALLDEVIKRQRTYHSGRIAPIACTCIDMQGHASGEVCTYTKARQRWGVWAVRGEGGQGKPLIKSWSVYRKPAATVFTLGVDTGKDELSARLRVTEPGPGYCHFPKGEQGESVRGFDERFFLGLTSEKKIAVPTAGGFRKYVWQLLPNRENEPLDCLNYAGAALAIALDQKPDEMLSKMALREPWAMAANAGASPRKSKPLNSSGKINQGGVMAGLAV